MINLKANCKTIFKYKAYTDFPGGTSVKNTLANAGDTRDTGLIPGWRRSPEEELATHSSVLTWKIA